MPTTEDDLFTRARSGDADAVSELLQRAGPAVRVDIAPSIPVRWRAVLTLDDVMQEAYIGAFLDIGSFVGLDEHAFRAWLLQIARNDLRDAVRSLSAQKRGGDRRAVGTPGTADTHHALLDVLASSASTPSRRLARHEARRALEQAIAELPGSYRVVVVAYDLERRPVAEVAELIGRSVGAVYMVRTRAHERLRRILGTGSAFFSEIGTP